jgi:hypothetical protein
MAMPTAGRAVVAPRPARFYNLDTGFISGGHYIYEVAAAHHRHRQGLLADDFLGASPTLLGVQHSDAVAGGPTV